MDKLELPTVAICAIVRDEAEYIEEWVEFHRAQGVQIFRIYDNNSTDCTSELLSRMGITAIPWTERQWVFDAEQIGAYLDGCKALAGVADWVAYIDVDEFLFGRHNLTLAEALVDFGADIGAIAVQQRIFGSGWQEHKLPGKVTDRFIRCSAPDYHENFWFKSISRPDCVETFDSVHSVLLSCGRYAFTDGTDLQRDAGSHSGHGAILVHGNIGLHHYIVKSKAEFLRKAEKWSDRDTDGLNRRVENYFNGRLDICNTHECRDLCSLRDELRDSCMSEPADD